MYLIDNKVSNLTHPYPKNDPVPILIKQKKILDMHVLTVFNIQFVIDLLYNNLFLLDS